LSTVVYISNKEIQIVTGTRGKKASAKQFYLMKAPEGSVINGMVLDVNAFQTFLKEFWEANNLPKKDVYLLTSSNKIAGKMVKLPVMNKKKSTAFIQREFADMERDENTTVISYLPLKAAAKMRSVYASMLSRDSIKELADVFTNAGITLSGIASSDATEIAMIERTCASKNRTFVVQILDGNMVTNILWLDGKFNYINSIRCFHEPGTQEFYDDASRALGKMRQFMMTQKIESPIERVYLAGTDESNVAFYDEMLKAQDIQAPVELITPSTADRGFDTFKFQRIFPAVSGLFDFGPENDFLRSLKDGEKKESADQKAISKGRLVTLAVIAGVMILLFGGSLTARLIREGQLKSLQSYNDGVASQINEYDLYSAERDALEQQSLSLDNVVSSIDTYPLGNEDVLSVIESTAKGYADIKIDSFDAEAGVVNIIATAPAVSDINKYIARLLQEDIFMDVTYTGYTMNADGTWDIHVICTLTEGAGR